MGSVLSRVQGLWGLFGIGVWPLRKLEDQRMQASSISFCIFPDALEVGEEGDTTHVLKEGRDQGR